MGNITEKKKFKDLQVEDIFNRRWIPYVWFLIWTSIIHISGYDHCMDDVFVKSLLQENLWEEIKYLLTTPNGWSSRVIINPPIHYMFHLGPKVWMVCDIVIFMIIFHVMQKYIVNKDNVAHVYIVMSLLSIMPYLSFEDIGWITCTMTYAWTTAAAVVMCLTIKASYEGKKLKWYMCALYLFLTIYATNKEEVSVMFVIIFFVVLIYAIKNKKNWIVIAVQLGISLINVIMHMFAPGNKVRYELATREEFLYVHNGIEKLFIGMSATLKHVFLEYNFIAFVFCVILAIATWINCKKIIPRLCSLVPFVVLFVGDMIAGPNEDFTFVLDGNEYAIIVTGIITVLSIFTCIIYMYGKNDKTLLSLTLLTAGFAGRSVLGFASWGWQTYERTYYYLYFVFVLVACIVVCDTWNKIKPKYKPIVMAAILLLGMLGVLINGVDTEAFFKQ